MIMELNKYGEVTEHASLKNFNTYRIDGKVKYLIEPYSIPDLVKILEILDANRIRFMILGNGSNVIFRDEEYDGAFIKLSHLDALDVLNIDEFHNVIYAEAGVMLPRLVSYCVDNSLTGLEFAAGIPGTVGGGIYGNAGAYNSCLLDYVHSVTVMDLDNNYDIKVLEHEDIIYGYRHSMFKEKKQYVILGVKFDLEYGDQENSLAIMADRKKRRMESQPLEYPSAGSVFRNPEGDFAGRLIEFCQLKGKRIGGAEVSTKHANFVINKENASGKDVRDLIKFVHDDVLERANVDLIIEQEFIDWE